MYFYLEWINKRPTQIKLLKNKPKKINFENTFKIKEKIYILCGWINPDFKQFIPPSKLVFNKPQYLISHLQKCIRRMETDKSIKTSKHIIDLDYNCFIRRLPIIMLEDVTIHSSFPIIIWLMIAATKKFHMKQEIIKWLLGVVYHLSKCDIPPSYLNKDIEEIPIDTNNVLLQSLRFRKAYGGMKGDMNMIEYYTQSLHKNIKDIDNSKIPIIKIDIDSLRKSEWLIEANDFHCNRYIIPYIKQLIPSFSNDYIKLLIWKFSSCHNKRIQIENKKEQENDWNKIKKWVIQYQKNCRIN